jgi:hypothetical protein
MPLRGLRPASLDLICGARKHFVAHRSFQAPGRRHEVERRSCSRRAFKHQRAQEEPSEHKDEKEKAQHGGGSCCCERAPMASL